MSLHGVILASESAYFPRYHSTFESFAPQSQNTARVRCMFYTHLRRFLHFRSFYECFKPLKFQRFYEYCVYLFNAYMWKTFRFQPAAAKLSTELSTVLSTFSAVIHIPKRPALIKFLQLYINKAVPVSASARPIWDPVPVRPWSQRLSRWDPARSCITNQLWPHN